MDYKQKYEGLMRNIEHLYESVNPEWKRTIECYIPELKETEDERIRKSLIKHIEGITSWNYFLGISREQMLAWLEKQGEPEAIVVVPKFRVGDTIRPKKGFMKEYTIESISGECYHGKGGWGIPICCDDDYELVEQKTIEPVTVIERDGEQWVRVCALGEDFIIAAHDYREGDKTEFTWEEACKIGTFSKKQGYIILALLNEINAKLEEIGGEPLDSHYWSSSEYYSNGAWVVYFNSGYVYGNGKYTSVVARAVAAF